MCTRPSTVMLQDRRLAIHAYPCYRLQLGTGTRAGRLSTHTPTALPFHIPLFQVELTLPLSLPCDTLAHKRTFQSPNNHRHPFHQ